MKMSFSKWRWSLGVALILSLNVQAVAGAATGPKVLLFSAIDGEYLVDTARFWGGEAGVDGFILAYVADWWTTKDEAESKLALLKRINDAGRQFGIDSNFIKVALGYRELPLWTDDQAWVQVEDNFRHIATLARQSGTKGILIDTEKYNVMSLFDSTSPRFKTIGRERLGSAVRQRGAQIMRAIIESYPDAEIIVLPEGQHYWEIGHKEYELWIDFYKGMESVKNKQGIVVGTEGSTFTKTNENDLKQAFEQVQASMLGAVDDRAFWQSKGSVAIGLWPLGSSYQDKSARYSPSVFGQLFAQARSLPSKYVWIYGQGAAWFQLSDTEIKKYTRNGRWIWVKESQGLPTDINIDKYYSELKSYKLAR